MTSVYILKMQVIQRKFSTLLIMNSSKDSTVITEDRFCERKSKSEVFDKEKTSEALDNQGEISAKTFFSS